MLSLSTGTKRFKQISKDIGGITDKMLSKELKILEINKLAKREVFDSFPPTVAYSITARKVVAKIAGRIVRLVIKA